MLSYSMAQETMRLKAANDLRAIERADQYRNELDRAMAETKAEKPKYAFGDRLMFRVIQTGIPKLVFGAQPISEATVKCVSDCGTLFYLCDKKLDGWWSDLTDIDVVGVVRAPKHGEIFAETTFSQPLSVDDFDTLSVIYEYGRRDGAAQKMGEDIKTPSELYNDLIYCVDQRITGETRHETAKRWLTERVTDGCAHSDANPVAASE